MKITLEHIEKIEKSIIVRLIFLFFWRGVSVYFSKEAFFNTTFVIVAGIYILFVMMATETSQKRENHLADEKKEA